MLEWIQVGGGPLESAVGSHARGLVPRRCPCAGGARGRGHRWGAGPRAWDPQWTPTAPPPESSQAYMGRSLTANEDCKSIANF